MKRRNVLRELLGADKPSIGTHVQVVADYCREQRGALARALGRQMASSHDGALK